VSAPVTPLQFRHRIESMIRGANPDAQGLRIVWLRCNRCTWADGSKGFSGTVMLSAKGHRPTQKVVTLDGHGWSA
jgi:hypothetical protein